MSWRSRRGRGGWPEGVWTKGCAAMKRSAGSVTPERGSLAVSSNMQNVTVPPELDDALDTMTRPVDQRPPPIRHSADASPPARQNGVAPGEKFDVASSPLPRNERPACRRFCSCSNLHRHSPGVIHHSVEMHELRSEKRQELRKVEAEGLPIGSGFLLTEGSWCPV
ncbi:uncharacterized protein sb:cb288 isoform X1 [Rhincodon typus]|uniref:uncharacterized protein sb:cb288 isoform X1 n=1 Tax=Rhincodon typus TaxID=259920 RepID=UPI00202E4694|nr:uncharacterized protein sb:cb288 isoform X1 [Rhincodon typus]